MSKTKRPRLGRGLNSLMSKTAPVEPPASRPKPRSTPAAASQDRHLEWVPLDAVEPNPFQPRRTFDPQSLADLAQSIRQAGLMQPVVLRPLADEPARYQLVAGERRWRAAREAELKTIPAIVRQLSDQQIAEWAVIENLQREDLDPIERAEAFARLASRFKLTHEQIAGQVGINRVSVTNTLRLLDLHNDIQDLIRHAQLSAGHGRALLAIQDPEAQRLLAGKSVSSGWSVRALEAAVKQALAGADLSRKKTRGRAAHLRDLERQIAHQLQTKVRLKPGRKKGSGTLSVDFFDLDQFDAILKRLGVNVHD
ncbi:MAG: ParB/RepB/Spo0J family partition protein [Phycisphaerae bacterium]|nr:ParB/RepB/Spo0J family partition protein [Phycisphaerae bacterium]